MIHARPVEKYLVVTVYDDFEEGVVTHATKAKAMADFKRQSGEYPFAYLCKILDCTP